MLHPTLGLYALADGLATALKLLIADTDPQWLRDSADEWALLIHSTESIEFADELPAPLAAFRRWWTIAETKKGDANWLWQSRLKIPTAFVEEWRKAFAKAQFVNTDPTTARGDQLTTLLTDQLVSDSF